MDQYLARQTRDDIRNVLMDIWDPIGIKNVPQASDEYDSYLGEVMELLVSEKSGEEIARHLLEIVTKRMELSSARLEDMTPAVKALRAIPLP